MVDFDLAHEHMEVIGSDGQHVGAFQRVHGDALVLATSGQQQSGPHLPLMAVDSVDTVVRLNITARDAIKRFVRRDVEAVANNSAPTS